MKSAIFAALVLLSGCGFHGSTYPEPQPQPYPGEPVGQTAFVVDDGAGVTADPNTYAITTANNTWRLVWLGDAFQHHFTGTVTCPVGGQFTSAQFANAYPGDTVSVNGVQAVFDAVTDAATPQILDLDATSQPLSYNLQIDGQPAIGAVVFQSQGVRSTTDTMPFSVYSGIYSFKVGEKPQLAPQFISQLPGDGASQTVKVPAPGPGSTAASIVGVQLQK